MNFKRLVLRCIDADFCKQIIKKFVGIWIWFEKEIEKMEHGKRLKNEHLDK